MSSIIRKNPFQYKLAIYQNVNGQLVPFTVRFRNLLEIKAFLKRINANGVKSQLSKISINYSNSGKLSSTYTTVNELLENITYSYYWIEIERVSESASDAYVFYSIEEFKRFISNYESSMGTGPSYIITKYTMYFDKDDNYALKEDEEIITDI